MALIKCHECNTEISDTAKTCPKCGTMTKSESSNRIWIAISIIFFGLLFIFQFIIAPKL